MHLIVLKIIGVGLHFKQCSSCSETSQILSWRESSPHSSGVRLDTFRPDRSGNRVYFESG